LDQDVRPRQNLLEVLAQRGILDGKDNSDEHRFIFARDRDLRFLPYIVHLLGCQGPIPDFPSTGIIGGRLAQVPDIYGNMDKSWVYRLSGMIVAISYVKASAWRNRESVSRWIGTSEGKGRVMLVSKCSKCGKAVKLGRLMSEQYVVGTNAISGIRAHKLAAVFAGAVLLFMIGCTPDSSNSSSDSSNSSGTSTVSQAAPKATPATGGANDPLGSQVALNLTSATGGTNDPTSDSPGDLGAASLASDPGTDSPGDGPSATVPEPATCALFLCAAGSMALARRLRARKDA
jgi:hypothetical protein